MNKRLISIILSTLLLGEISSGLLTKAMYGNQQPNSQEPTNRFSTVPGIIPTVPGFIPTFLHFITPRGIFSYIVPVNPENPTILVPIAPQPSVPTEPQPAPQPVLQPAPQPVLQSAPQPVPQLSAPAAPQPASRSNRGRKRKNPLDSQLQQTAPKSEPDSAPKLKRAKRGTPETPNPKTDFPYREVIKKLEDNVAACSAPIPLRALKWHDRRCWFHASLLHLYHNRFYHDFIINFPAEEASRVLTSSTDLSIRERKALEAMICLANVFRIIEGDHQSSDYRKPQVVSLGSNFEDELISKLQVFDSYATSIACGETLLLNNDDQRTCELVLYQLLKECATYAQNNPSSHMLSKNWPNPSSPYSIFKRGTIPIETAIKYMDLFDRFGHRLGGHFWVETTINGQIFEIGKDIPLPQDAISIKSGGATTKPDTK